MTTPFLSLDAASRYQYLQQKCIELIEECDQIAKKDRQDEIISDKLFNYRMMFAYLTQELKRGQNALLQNTILINCRVLALATIKICHLMEHSKELSESQIIELIQKKRCINCNSSTFSRYCQSLSRIYRICRSKNNRTSTNSPDDSIC